MFSTKSKLRLMGAFAALFTLALASCQGFFPPHVLQSITLQPTSPQFQVGYTQAMQAWGVDQNNDRYQLTTGVSWSVSAPSSGTVATIDESTGTLTGVNVGTITVTASDEGLSATATATVIEIVTAMTITPTTNSVTADGTSYASFTITDQNGNNISSLVTLTAYQGNSQITEVQCGFQSQTDNNEQNCIADTGFFTTTTTVTLVVTYSGYTGSQVSATLTVNL